MLPSWLTSLTAAMRKKRTLRKVGASILDHIDREGSLVLDKNGLSLLGVSRKIAFQAMYELTMHEQAHMRASKNGQVIVMSNVEFSRFMRQRAEISGESARFSIERPILPIPTPVVAPLTDTEDAAETPLFPAFAVETDGEYDWFSLEVAANETETEESEPELPPFRQSLPFRSREPWAGDVVNTDVREKKSDIFQF